MKSIYKNKSESFLNTVDDVTEFDIARLRLMELRERAFLRRLQCKQVKPKVAVDTLVTILITLLFLTAVHLLIYINVT
ncbi:MAG TPA: hypothetical protein VGE26_09130 [Sphingobacteriaceae bacterium]